MGLNAYTPQRADQVAMMVELVHTTRRLQHATHQLRMLDVARYDDDLTEHTSSSIQRAIPINLTQ